MFIRIGNISINLDQVTKIVWSAEQAVVYFAVQEGDESGNIWQDKICLRGEEARQLEEFFHPWAKHRCLGNSK